MALAVGLLLVGSGSASAAHSQATPALAPLALPEQLVMMCRVVTADELDMADQLVVAREFIFAQQTPADGPAGAGSKPERTIAIVFGPSGSLVMLSDRYRDAEMGTARMIARLENGALMGSTTSIRLADIQAGKGMAGVPESSVLGAEDSLRAEQLTAWLWQRRCGRSSAAVR